MGEYAIYQDNRIKIGTCESMYYLRADQRFLVRAVPGNVDPVGDGELIRFRFPFPDEDQREPGDFSVFARGERVSGVEVPAGVSHYEQACAGNSVAVTQQRLVGDHRMLVCRCEGCGAIYRLPEWSDAKPVAVACLEQAIQNHLAGAREKAHWWHEVSKRICAGYGVPLVFGGSTVPGTLSLAAVSSSFVLGTLAEGFQCLSEIALGEWSVSARGDFAGNAAKFGAKMAPAYWADARWEFSDGSAVSVYDNCWDVAYADCDCWPGAAPHERGECPNN